jgi:SAM-dependent methyltransferase
VNGCTFPVERSARLREIEEWHFWFVARRRLVGWLLASRVGPRPGLLLDVGCGTGHTLHTLASSARQALGIDTQLEGFDGAARPEAGLLCAADVATLPLAEGCADVALALDVLEHVDDAVVLAEIKRVLTARGALILTVPAFPGLWSHRDDAAGHLRRYTKASLTTALGRAGFAVSWLSFYQATLLPVLALTRVAGRRSSRPRDAEDRVSGLANAVFGWVNRAEVAGLRAGLRYPFGSSLVALARPN